MTTELKYHPKTSDKYARSINYGTSSATKWVHQWDVERWLLHNGSEWLPSTKTARDLFCVIWELHRQDKPGALEALESLHAYVMTEKMYTKEDMNTFWRLSCTEIDKRNGTFGKLCTCPKPRVGDHDKDCMRGQALAFAPPAPEKLYKTDVSAVRAYYTDNKTHWSHLHSHSSGKVWALTVMRDGWTPSEYHNTPTELLAALQRECAIDAIAALGAYVADHGIAISTPPAPEKLRPTKPKWEVNPREGVKARYRAEVDQVFVVWAHTALNSDKPWRFASSWSIGESAHSYAEIREVLRNLAQSRYATMPQQNAASQAYNALIEYHKTFPQAETIVDQKHEPYEYPKVLLFKEWGPVLPKCHKCKDVGETWSNEHECMLVCSCGALKARRMEDHCERCLMQGATRKDGHICVPPTKPRLMYGNQTMEEYVISKKPHTAWEDGNFPVSKITGGQVIIPVKSEPLKHESDICDLADLLCKEEN